MLFPYCLENVIVHPVNKITVEFIIYFTVTVQIDLVHVLLRFYRGINDLKYN